jgi:hypothetical protein
MKMYYSSEEFMKRIPGDTRGIEAEKMLEWCAKDLGVRKPKIKFFFWHRNKKLYDLESKRGEMPVSQENKTDGFYLVGKNTIFVYFDLSLKRTLHVVAHECKHYQADIQGTDKLMWHGDREQDAESYAHYAMKYYRSNIKQETRTESQAKPAKRESEPEKDLEKSERYLMYQYLTNNGFDPNRCNY